MRQKDLKRRAGSVHYAVGDALQAERVAAQYRKINKKAVTTGTSTHQIQQSTLEGTVFCVIERPLSYLKDVLAEKKG